MTLALIFSRAVHGIETSLITVEVHLSRGLVKFNMVGLPETAVKESKDRVRSAIINSNFEFPARRITVNLAPADLPKGGGQFDLPIALGILAATKQIPSHQLANYEFTGELALSGEIREVSGILPMTLASLKAQRQLILPFGNASEASIIKDSNALAAKTLLAVCAHLSEKEALPYVSEVITNNSDDNSKILDIADVVGQAQAKRALMIAAAGKHSLIMVGPPGTGKTMLASRLPSLLPALKDDEALEAAAIASLSTSGFKPAQWKQIPFRSPHHSCSNIALAGGGRPPKPGEISLAHHGVLFLDELPEFDKKALEILREPLESGEISISRASFQAKYPASFQLIAAMNPCPCGYAGSLAQTCHCSLEQIKKYLNKISGPLLDRIDMQVEVASVPANLFMTKNNNETSEVVRHKINQVREFQYNRQGKFNALLSVSELDQYANLEDGAKKILIDTINRFNLSARTFHRIVKLARSIADYDFREVINKNDIGEALQYRALERLKAKFFDF